MRPQKEQARQIKSIFSELIREPLQKFPKQGERLEAPTEHGVYIIYSPGGNVMHVGRTLRGGKGLQRRLKNHLYGRSSFVRLHMDGMSYKLRRGYAFRCLSVKNARQRALLEAYAIGVLCPKHIGLGDESSLTG
ncbi:GIY-YIG nuclease family protein [Hyphococcus sp.]|uniref:GIY-YIG nuclease family protein n=1 Tax=Hyphococcus sp. TaxID=2038636 RepID=UPI0035C7759E